MVLVGLRLAMPHRRWRGVVGVCYVCRLKTVVCRHMYT